MKISSGNSSKHQMYRHIMPNTIAMFLFFFYSFSPFFLVTKYNLFINFFRYLNIHQTHQYHIQLSTTQCCYTATHISVHDSNFFFQKYCCTCKTFILKWRRELRGEKKYLQQRAKQHNNIRHLLPAQVFFCFFLFGYDDYVVLCRYCDIDK